MNVAFIKFETSFFGFIICFSVIHARRLAHNPDKACFLLFIKGGGRSSPSRSRGRDRISTP